MIPLESKTDLTGANRYVNLFTKGLEGGDIMYWLVLIIIVIIVATLLRQAFKKRKIRGGYWNILIGTAIGAWIADVLLGNWGWMTYGVNVIAGIIGSLIIGGIYTIVVAKKSIPNDY